MTLLLIIAAAAAYLAIALCSMRPLYGRWRARSIDSGRRNYPALYANASEAGKVFNNLDRPPVMFCAALAGLLWPASLPLLGAGSGLARWMGGTAVRSHLEQEELVEAQAKRIAELERELGIGGGR